MDQSSLARLREALARDARLPRGDVTTDAAATAVVLIRTEVRFAAVRDLAVAVRPPGKADVLAVALLAERAAADLLLTGPRRRRARALVPARSAVRGIFVEVDALAVAVLETGRTEA